MVTFGMSIFWIAAFSYVMVWMVSETTSVVVSISIICIVRAHFFPCSSGYGIVKKEKQ